MQTLSHPHSSQGWFGKAATWLKKVFGGFSAPPPPSSEMLYLRTLAAMSDTLPVQGLVGHRITAIKIDELFVQPWLILRATLSSKGALAWPKTLREGRHGIWAFLEAMQKSQQHLALLGPAGSGKSTLLRYVAWALATEHEEARGLSLLPILLDLSTHSQDILNNSACTLADVVHQALTRQDKSFPLLPDWFNDRFIIGNCLIMFDGLHEIGDADTHWRLMMWLDQQMTRYAENYFVVASRPLEYRHYPFQKTSIVEIQPFTRRQRERLIQHWHGATSFKPSQSSGFELYDLKFSSLVSNPLQLTMLLTVAYHKGTPQSENQLALLLHERLLEAVAKDAEFNLTPAQSRRILQALAHRMIIQRQRQVREEEAVRAIYVPLDMLSHHPKGERFLQMVAHSTHLLSHNETKDYRFGHLIFQESLAALYFHEQGDQQTLLQHVEDSWWHETILAYALLADASPVIMTCLKKSRPSLATLELAIRCAQLAPTVSPQAVAELENALEQAIEGLDPLRRQMAAEALLALRLKRMMPVSFDLYVADSLITNTEYHLFINEQGYSHLPPAHWVHGTYPANMGKQPVVGVRPVDAVAFCEWLTERDTRGFHYRLPKAGEFNSLVDNIGYWTIGESFQEYELENEPQLARAMRDLEERFADTLTLDMLQYGEPALEKVLKLAQQLEESRTPSHALALAREFALDRAHVQAEAGSVSIPDSYRPPTKDVSFIAQLTAETFLSLLRQQPPRPWPELFNEVNDQQLPESPQWRALAKQYFELYNDLSRFEERTQNKLSASRGIRIVQYRSVISETAPEAVPITAPQPPPTKARPAPARRAVQKKICLLGDSGVGKTSLVRRFVEQRFDEKYISTMGVNISRKTIVRPAYTMNLLLWDMEGSGGFQRVQLSYLRGAAGAIIVCDLSRRETLAAFERYASQLRDLNPNAGIVLVGNKVDLPHRAIENRDLQTIAEKLGATYLLTSAKTGTQVNDAFHMLADQMEG